MVGKGFIRLSTVLLLISCPACGYRQPLSFRIFLMELNHCLYSFPEYVQREVFVG